MKKTMLKSSSPPGTPATSGKVARMMGTAPRRPAHPHVVCSRSPKREPRRLTYTASGRAASIRNTVTSTATPITGTIRLGEDEQSECEEHADLREPRETVVEAGADSRLCR